MELGRQQTALIVIDMQNGFCKATGSVDRIGFDIGMLTAAIEPCRKAIALARAASVPVIFTRYVYRADFADGGLMVTTMMPCCAIRVPSYIDWAPEPLVSEPPRIQTITGARRALSGVQMFSDRQSSLIAAGGSE